MAFTNDPNRVYDHKERLANKLVELSRTANSVDEIYKETLRELQNHFSDVWYTNEENEKVEVEVYHAFAERAISKKLKDNTLILPIITVGQSSAETDQDRGRFRSVLLNETWWDVDAERAIRTLSLAPVPVTINYEVSIWAKYTYNMDMVVQMLRTKFNPALEIDPPSSPKAKVFLTGEDNESSMVVGDGEDRLIRKNLLISVETYITYPRYRVTSTGRIERVVGDLRICNR